MAIEVRRRWGLGLLGLALCLCAPARSALAQQREVEPNNNCELAQPFQADPLPLRGTISQPDVDYYRYSGTPGEAVVIDLRQDTTGNGLYYVRLGIFNSSCSNLFYANEDYQRIRTVVTVPDDGQLVVAATSWYDYDFTGRGSYSGTYQLSAAIPIGSIRGRLIDSASGNPIPGESKPFGSVELQRCTPQCNSIGSLTPNALGEFEFAGGNFEMLAGLYQLSARANEYETFTGEVFEVEGGENFDAGDLKLVPPPILFEAGRPCRVLPQGGVCTYSVRIVNNTDEPLEGVAWSLVTGDFPNVRGLSFEATSGSPSDTIVRRPTVSVPPLSSEELDFRFALPSFAPNGTNLCITLNLGLNPSPLGNPARGDGNLFCVTKGPRGFRLLDERESHSAFRQLRGER
jgi:hypothetical protein